MPINLPSASSPDPKILALHNDPVDYRERCIRSEYRLPEVLSYIYRLKNIDTNDSFLDLGCGDGMVGRVLESVGHRGPVYANDISQPMLVAAGQTQTYNQGLLGPADEALDWYLAGGTAQHGPIDWIVSFSVTYYWPPDYLAKVLSLSCQLAQKGIIVSFDGVTHEVAKKWSEKTGGPVPVYDYRDYFSYNEIPIGWQAETVHTGFAWRARAAASKCRLTSSFCCQCKLTTANSIPPETRRAFLLVIIIWFELVK